MVVDVNANVNTQTVENTNPQGVVNDTNVNTQTTQPTETQTTQTVETKQNIPLTEEAFKDFKSFYDKQFTDFKKELQGRDKKISELQKIVNESKTKELTEEQKREIEKSKIHDEYHNLFVEQTIAKFNLKQFDQDMDFSGFFYSNNENPEEMRNEIVEKGQLLNDYITKAIKIGIEKGVNDRLAQGYVPKSGNSPSNSDDFEKMTKEQLADRASEIGRMPASQQKTELLNKLMSVQAKRMSNR